MADLTIPNKSEYCIRHGYSFIQETFTAERHWFPGWDRIPCLIRLLKSDLFDWIWWLGCDCLITNLTIKVESLLDDTAGIIIATDANEIQMDSFFIQKGHRGMELLEHVWNTRDQSLGPWFEQSNLMHHMYRDPYKYIVKIVPQRLMNSMQYDLYPDYYVNPRFISKTDCIGTDGEWRPGDFVFHVPGRPLETKLRVLREKLPQIQT